jgi:hypothetical protein
MTTLRVWKAHRIVKEHPAGSTFEVAANDVLVVTEPHGRRVRYAKGDWHVCEANDPPAVCGYVEDDPTCPNCYPPE